MNVCVEYLYRDAGNYKSWGEVVFSNGSNLEAADIEARIRAVLIDGEFFVAENVGIPVLYFKEHDDELDHQWHEFSSVKNSSKEMDDTGGRDITELLSSLRRAYSTVG